MKLCEYINEVKDSGFEATAALVADWAQQALGEEGKLRRAAQLCAGCAVEAAIIGSTMLAHELQDKRQSGLYLSEGSTQD